MLLRINAFTVPQVWKGLERAGNTILVVYVLFGTLDRVSSRSVSLPGAGASFPAAVYSQWMAAFTTHRLEHVSLDMSYSAVGSGRGTEMIVETSSSPSPDDIVYAGSDYKLNGVNDSHLFLTYPTLAG